jgi:uncharacterized protein with PQ loop repeat
MEVIEGILLLVIQICTFACYFPQIIKTIRTKRSEDVAVTSWAISMVSALSYTIYGIIKNDSFIIFTCVTEMILAIISVLVIIKYKKHA